MNRNKLKQFAITFPQCGEITRQEFMENMPPFEFCAVSMEAHEGGGFHLHMALKLKKGLTKSQLLKFMIKKYPNDYKRIDIQSTRSIKNWYDYIRKEDPEVLVQDNTEDKKYQVNQELLRLLEEKYDPIWQEIAKEREQELKEAYERQAEEFKNFQFRKPCSGCEKICRDCKPIWQKYWASLK